MNVTSVESNADAVEFYNRWHLHRPKDKRGRWGYVYIASEHRNGIRLPSLGARDQAHCVKIGVSIKPWKRMREVSGARSIAVAYFVHRPFILETGLHKHFREYGTQDVEWRRKMGDAEYIEYCRSAVPVHGEWFLLPTNMLYDALRIMDLWQLMSPHAPIDAWDHPPSVWSGAKGNPLTVWRYSSFEPAFQSLYY